MGSHPINLAIRFLLELCALVAIGNWGWKQSDSWLRYLLAAILPISCAILWATFAVPDDPSRSGTAPVPTAGYLRLLLELLFFSFAIWTLYDSGKNNLSLSFGLLFIFHYFASYDRILWLLKQYP